MPHMLMYSLVFIRVFVRLYSGELSAAPVPDYTCHPPRVWAERFDVRRWTKMPQGGHFAAMEEPSMLAQDVRAWFRPFRH
jgi:pimeloyl-ACP methyl ester carboxylesterase